MSMTHVALTHLCYKEKHTDIDWTPETPGVNHTLRKVFIITNSKSQVNWQKENSE